MIKLKTYKILSRLLLYPDEDLRNNIFLIENLLREDYILNIFHIRELSQFVNYILENDLLFLQENYVSLFDRQKQFSLYLFEHIHGDSRTRGMAMVDLKNLYKLSNVDVPLGGELPDYLPVFLEYLSTLSLDSASVLLGEIINIIAVIGFRLKKINSIYNVIFFALESLSSVRFDNAVINNALNSSDKNFQFIDRNFEDSKIF